MAHLWFSAFQWRTHSATELDNGPDGASAGTVATASDTGIVRSPNAASIKCAGTTTATSYRTKALTAPTAGTTLYQAWWIRLSALPAATTTIMDFGGALTVKLTSAGKLQLWNGVTQIGADSTTSLTTGAWYLVQLGQRLGVGTTDYAELLVQDDTGDPSSVESAASADPISISDTQPTIVRCGWITAPGATCTLYIDSAVLNDSTGTRNKTWPGYGNTILVTGQSTAMGTQWLTCANNQPGGADISNQPPVGHAHLTTHTAVPAHQMFTNFDTTPQGVNCVPLNTRGVPCHLKLIGWGSTMISWSIGSNASSRKTAFLIRANGTLNYIDVLIRKQGTPTDNLLIDLYTDASNAVGTLIQNLATYAPADVPTTLTRVRIDNINYTLPSSGVVWIMFSASRGDTLDATNFYYFGGYSSANPYFTSAPYAMASTWNGTSWLAPNKTETPAANFILSSGSAYVTGVQGHICHGEAVATGTQAGTIALANPTTATASFNFGDDLGAAGSFPTNWRWATTPIAQPVGRPTMLGTAVNIIKVTSSTRNVLCCAVGVYVRYLIPNDGWVRWQKTADSTFWWVKLAQQDTVAYRGDGTEVICEAGDYFINADPLDGFGDLTTITEDSLFAAYTPV